MPFKLGGGEPLDGHSGGFPRGYQHLFGSSPQLDLQSTGSKPALESRPHHKDLMHTVVQGERRRSDKKRMRALSIAATTTDSEVVRKALRMQLREIGIGVVDQPFPGMAIHNNPVAAAMDAPFVPNTRVQAARPLPKLPSAYRRQMHNMKLIQERLEFLEQEEALQHHGHSHAYSSDDPTPRLSLRFTPDVQKERGEWPFGMFPPSEVFKQPRILKSKVPIILRNNRDVAFETDIVHHKSSWIKELKIHKRWNEILTEQRGEWYKGALLKSQELLYDDEGRIIEERESEMAQLWRQWLDSDGLLDLEEVLGARSGKVHGTSRGPSLYGSESPNSPRHKSISARISRSEPIIEPEVDTGGQTLSKGTIRLLKKLTQDANPGSVISNEEMHEILKHTLMGTGETTEPFVNPLGAVKVQRYPRKLGRRRGFRIDTSEANEPHDDDSKDFKLVLPSVLRDDDASTESGITTMFADSKMQPMTDSFTKYMDIPTQELEEAAAAPSDDADGTEAKSGDDLKVARAKSFRYVRKKEAQTSEWSLAFAVAMIKQRAMPRPKQKDESEGETQSNATSVIEELGDFLNTPYTEYPVVPEKHTPAYQAIFQTMMLALREGDRFLKYEAVRILVMMGAQFSTLGRWDNISFKAALHEMIRHGAEHQRFLAATTLCELDNVDEHVFRELQKGLGDVEEQRRNKSKAMLERMGTEYVHQVFSILVEESRNSSWRARRETVDLLEKWIHRLSPKAAVDSDGASEPAPGMNGNGSTNDPSNGPKGSNKAARPAPKPKPKPPPTEEEIKKQQERLEMIDRAVQILLDLMWNDWSTEVRNGSAQALGRLGRGRSVFDRIVHLLESNDPLRKIDALKALGSIGVMTKSAMDNYLACFVDSHHSVRIQACKVACVLATNNRQLVGALIDRFDDYDWRVRAYAVKAVGLSRCKESKIREALLYFLYHEPEAPVRVEAARSIGELGLLEIDAAFKDALVTVIETDKSEMVRKEAQAVLVQARAITTETIGGAPSGTSAPSSAGDRAAGHSGHPGHPGHPGHSGHSGHEPGDTQAHHPGGGGMFSSHPSATLTESNNTLSSMSSLRGSTLFPTAPTARPVPFPHILSGRSEAEVDIFLRDELVGEKEQRAVIEQVENMTTKGQVIAEVLQLDALSAYMEESGLDLVFGAEHSPMVHEIHHPRRRRPISLGLPEPQMRGGRRVPKIDYA